MLAKVIVALIALSLLQFVVVFALTHLGFSRLLPRRHAEAPSRADIANGLHGRIESVVADEQIEELIDVQRRALRSRPLSDDLNRSERRERIEFSGRRRELDW